MFFDYHTLFCCRLSVNSTNIISFNSNIFASVSILKILKIINPFTQKKSLNLTAYSVKINAKKLKDLILEIKTALPPQEKNFYSKIKWVSNLKNAIPKGYSLMTANIKADNIIHDYFESRNFYLSANKWLQVQ